MSSKSSRQGGGCQGEFRERKYPEPPHSKKYACCNDLLGCQPFLEFLPWRHAESSPRKRSVESQLLYSTNPAKQPINWGIQALEKWSAERKPSSGISFFCFVLFLFSDIRRLTIYAHACYIFFDIARDAGFGCCITSLFGQCFRATEV